MEQRLKSPLVETAESEDLPEKTSKTDQEDLEFL
jgi:hypothetical protein